MPAFEEAQAITDELFYLTASNGCLPEGVLWATILELKCRKCAEQERWRGRSRAAVDKVARLRGWKFDHRSALCPQHSVKSPSRSKFVKYPPPTHCWCGEPVAKRAKYGVGRPPTKCEKHLKRKKVPALCN